MFNNIKVAKAVSADGRTIWITKILHPIPGGIPELIANGQHMSPLGDNAYHFQNGPDSETQYVIDTVSYPDF